MPRASSSRRLPTTTTSRPVVGLDRARDAATDDGREVGDPPEPELVLVRPGDDGRTERVLARALDGAGEVEQVARR